MSALGLRYCRNHADEPLMLHQTSRGLYWRCEHPDGCAYTENALNLRGSKAVDSDGRPVIGVRSPSRRGARTHGGSAVEKAAIERESS